MSGDSNSEVLGAIQKECGMMMTGFIKKPITLETLTDVKNVMSALLFSYQMKNLLSYYDVGCNEVNNPPRTREAGSLYVSIRIKLPKIAQFIDFDLVYSGFMEEQFVSRQY